MPQSMPENPRTGATYLPKEETGMSFPPDRTALLAIDPVNDFLSEGGAGWELTKTTVEKNDVVGAPPRCAKCKCRQVVRPHSEGS